MITRLTFCCLAFLSVAGSSQQNYSDEDLGTIIFANIMFRHGDRTPIESYPTDPYRDESSWPVPFGQLTNLGKHQHLHLGMWFRKRYNHLIPLTYSLYDIYVRSTDVDRTLMSAEANLAGLYPPYGDQQWDIKKWMPIPVHTVPQSEEIFDGKKYCERYSNELEKVLNSPEIQKINQDNAELYQYLSKMTGNSISSLQKLEYLYNTLYIEEFYNKTLPKWTKTVYPDKLKPLADKSFTIQAHNKILQRLRSGPLLKQMIENMVLKSKGALVPDRKLWIFSAHDETVANMLMTLNLFDPPHCPPYTATLLLELRLNKQNEHIVTISYKNTTGEPILLTLPGCIPACPLNQFISLTKDIIPENWERECLLDFEKYQYNVSANVLIGMLTLSVLMLVLLVILIILFMYWTYKKDSRYYLRLAMDGT